MNEATKRTFRFYACILIALVPLLIFALFDWFGLRVGRTTAGWATICTMLLLAYIAWRGFKEDS